MKQIKAFLLGMWEFRASVTTGFSDVSILNYYEKGRDFAHAITFRYFDF